MSAWTCRWCNGKADPKIVPPRPRIPWWKGRSADSEEKREPVSDIDTAVVDSLKVLDPKRPIREADIRQRDWHVRFSNRPFEVKHFQTIHHCSVDVAHGLALLFGI